MLNFVESIDATVVERIVYGFPAVAARRSILARITDSMSVRPLTSLAAAGAIYTRVS